MQRRNLIKAIACAAGYPALAGVSGSLLAQSAYQGKLLITVQLVGGVDVTSFCDPKMNLSGEPEINRWARTAETQEVGELRYAPYAGNATFFQKYYRDILVINGVDAQTNSHSVGVVNNWSGRNSVGFPSVTALMAKASAPDLPLAYLNFGGFGDTSSIIRSTVIDEISQLKDVVFPNIPSDGSESRFRRQSDWDRIRNLQTQNLARLADAENLLAGDRKHRQSYLDAFASADDIKEFGDRLPDEDSIQARRQIGDSQSTIHRQIQAALLAFSSGVSVSADLVEQGFDTHSDHDALHQPLLANATDAIDYLWTYAEELGLDDRLMVVIGSDFGRTPFFNAGEGKDHWPIGSYLVMERNAAYTNRMVGETDGGHNALAINPNSLQPDDFSGSIIKPAHVHKALRRYLALENTSAAQLFPFSNTEDFSFFS